MNTIACQSAGCGIIIIVMCHVWQLNFFSLKKKEKNAIILSRCFSLPIMMGIMDKRLHTF
jgi:hypothetical protein